MRKVFITTLQLLIPLVILAQKATISGYIKDAESGETLIGATIYETKSKTGAIANEYGFFSLTLPADSIHVRVSYIGYQVMEYHLKLDSDIQLPIDLSSGAELEGVVITATENIERQSQMSSIDISMDKVKALPVLLGEQDLIKTIQLFPGVQSGSEGSSGLYVRGGGPDQNLIILDGVPIYNASHLFGFFSIFNADAINSVKMIKGGFPAQYGGRLSSVLDIRMKEGNIKELHGEVSLGLLSSKMTLEGPIKKDKSSFIISGRRTYIDILAKPFVGKGGKGGSGGKDGGSGGGTNTNSGGYYFWDLNAKVNHIFSPKSRLYASGYFGRDKFYNTSTTTFNEGGNENENSFDNNLIWGNAIAALRWNKIVSSKLFMNVTGTFSQYQFRVNSDLQFSETSNDTTTSTRLFSQYDSGIRDWTTKVDLHYLPNSKHSVRFGLGNTYHTFIPGVSQQAFTENNTATIDSTFGSTALFSHEHWTYIEDDWTITDELKINVGIHFSGFLASGKWYNSIQPRLSGRYLLTEKSAIKLSYSRMTQYLHLLSNPSIGLPTDLWVPATDRIAPENSDQVALGYSQSLDKSIQFSVEAYYKNMSNLIDYREGISFVSSAENWQDLVVTGKGESYGAEFLVEKKIGKTSGWIGYTLSWTIRQFDELNFGDPYPHAYDRRHDIGIAVIHKFSERVDLGVVWVYGSGYVTTLAQQSYIGIDGLTGGGNVNFTSIEYIQAKNDYRMPSYHRLDIGVNLHKKKKHFDQTWSFGLYNAYSRQNPFYLYFDFDKNGNRSLYQMSLFPLLPSITYKIKF